MIDDYASLQMEAMTSYNGESTQNPDPIIEAEEGSGLVPAHRGTTYVVIKNLNVTKWGATIPSMEALVLEKNPKTIAEALGDLLELSGLFTSDDYDTSGVSGNLRGFAQMGLKAPIEGIRALMFTYDLDAIVRGVIDSDGEFHSKIVFFDKTAPTEKEVDDDDRGARASGDGGSELMQIERKDRDLLPTMSNVAFVDADRDWQPGNANFRRTAAGVFSQARIALPLTLTQAEAYDLARKMMWQSITNEGGTQIELGLPPSYIDVTEGDLLIVNDIDGREIRAKVTEIDRGANGLIQVKAIQEAVEIFS